MQWRWWMFSGYILPGICLWHDACYLENMCMIQNTVRWKLIYPPFANTANTILFPKSIIVKSEAIMF